jgi:hypothetical protein
MNIFVFSPPKPIKSITMKTIKFLSILTTMAVTFYSCSKGDTGATGPQGLAGANGVANISTTSITISPAQWSYNSLYYQWQYNFYTAIAYNSAVVGYVVSGNGDQVLPYETSGIGDAIIYSMADNWFQSTPYVQFQYTDYTSPTTTASYDTYFYLVIIPPSIIKQHPNTNWENSTEVAQLPEVQAAMHK